MKKTFVSTALLLSILAFGTRPAAAQCILQPGSSGQSGQTRGQNFLTLVHNLYAADFHPTHTIIVNDKTLQVPPWYTSSTDCGVGSLKSGYGVTTPLITDYLVVSDELSELAIVTALAEDETLDSRMMQIHNTIQAMQSATYSGLPCWIAEVSGNSITCRSQDTATDATARFGLAYYYAANNPAFPAASRATYRSAGDALAARHLVAEYAHGCYTSSVTGNVLCDWVAGGANTATAGVGNSGFEMWIGYFQDVARFLLAASVSTGNSVYSDRARDVVDQWLIANSFDGVHLSFGAKKFSWNVAGSAIAPHPIDAWDDADAPRALWMGDVLRAIDLTTHQAPLTGAYAKLSTWVQLVLAGSTQTATTSCIQYNPDGTVASTNCGDDYYRNGLGAGLYTYLSTSLLDDKLDTAFSRYDWTGVHNFDYTACFGLYRGLRPVKALAAAIGLDSAAYGGTSCTASHLLTVSKAGTGSGTVASSPAGLSCGSSCSVAFATGTAVTLSATPTAGSSFGGWSGGCTGTGACTVTLDADRSVAATFNASVTPPAAPTWLRVDTVSGTQLQLTWQDNSTNESGFKVERKQGCCGPWTPLPDAPANPTGTATYQNTGLLCGTTYAYRVWAFNSGGETAKTNEAAKATTACP